jgi:parallel beta-helix repeat protein
MVFAALWKMFKAPARRTARPAYSPRLEGLEGRWVPATINVTANSAASLQSAVANAHYGDTISVPRGTYNLTAPLNFTTSGVHLVAQGNDHNLDADDRGVVINAPNQATLDAGAFGAAKGAIIDINGATQVEISGFVIDGGGLTLDAAVRVRGNGSATIHYNFIQNTYTANANPLGYGIRVGDNGDILGSLTPGTAKIDTNSISSYNKGAIIVDGNGSNGTITNNSITGVGTSLFIDQNGVQISNSAAGRIQGNCITGNSFDFSSPITALGVEIYNTTRKVVVAQNAVNGNESGIEAKNSQNVQVYNNDVNNSLFDGIILTNSSNIDVENNDVVNGYGDGISLSGSSCNTIVNNWVCGSTNFGGLYLEYSDSNCISGNEFENNHLDGIQMLNSSHNTLSCNETEGNHQNGIQIDGGTDTTIVFDASTANCVDGIQLNNTSYVTIEADLVAANGRYGINLNGASHVTIMYNVIVFNGTSPINIDPTSSATLVQSNLIFGTITHDAVGSGANTQAVADSLSDADAPCACL